MREAWSGAGCHDRGMVADLPFSLPRDPDWATVERPPPGEVLRAFGAVGEPVRLAGGKGGTWRAGDVVLKPSEGDDEVRWRAEVLARLGAAEGREAAGHGAAGAGEAAGFRVARAVRAADGDWVAHGWEATRFVAGVPDQRRADEVVRTGAAFHAALAGVARPSFLDTRADPWANGERLAWGDAGVRRPSVLLDRLLEVRRPVVMAEQAVHGDLLGNVLFAEGLAPAVIDWAVYWRPPEWAAAVAVVDAMVWHGHGFELALRWDHLAGWGQMLVRAAVYRLGTWNVVGWVAEPEQAYGPVVRDIVAYVS